jgi:hypothetical protein
MMNGPAKTQSKMEINALSQLSTETTKRTGRAEIS